MSIDSVDPDLPQPEDLLRDAISARVLVVDDDLLVAQAFVFALMQQGFSAQFVVPATREHLQDAIASWKPQLALLDGNLPEDGPIAVVDLLHHSGVKVVIKSGNGEHGWLRERVGAGTGVVLESGVAFEELVQTLRRLLIETPSTESEVWSRPKPETEGRPTTRLSPFLVLTPLEQCVLAELMEGRTADAIAKANWVALSTVRSQIKSILQKLGVNSQLAAVALARQCGWVYLGGSEGPRKTLQSRHVDERELSREGPNGGIAS
jgi:DNA-binding NarL/FixJ family response regulator